MKRFGSLFKDGKGKKKSDDLGLSSNDNVSKTSKIKKKKTNNESPVHSLTDIRTVEPESQSEMKTSPKRKPSLIGRIFDTARKGICGSKRIKIDDSDLDSEEISPTGYMPTTSKQEKKEKNKSKKSSLLEMARLMFPKKNPKARPQVSDDAMDSRNKNIMQDPFTDDDNIFRDIDSYNVPLGPIKLEINNEDPVITQDPDETPNDVKLDESHSDIKKFDDDNVAKGSTNDSHEAFENASTPKEGKIEESHSVDSPLLTEVKVINPDLTTYSPPPDESAIEEIKRPERKPRRVFPKSDSSSDEKRGRRSSSDERIARRRGVIEKKIRFEDDSKQRKKQDQAQACLSDDESDENPSPNPVVDTKLKTPTPPTPKLSRKLSKNKLIQKVVPKNNCCPLCTKAPKIPVKLNCCENTVCAVCLQASWLCYFSIWFVPHQCPVCFKSVKKIEVEENRQLEKYLYLVYSYNTRLGYLSNFLYPAIQYEYCTLCEGRCKETLIVSCGHQYCTRCLFYHWNDTEDVNYIPFTCPMCRTPITRLYPSFGMGEFDKAAELYEMIEEYNERIEQLEWNLVKDVSNIQHLIN